MRTVHPHVEIFRVTRSPYFMTAKPPQSSTQLQSRLRCVAVLCSLGFLPWLVSSASSTISHAAAKIASSPCSCQNSMSNERSGKAPCTSRVFQFEFRGMFIALRILLFTSSAYQLSTVVFVGPASSVSVYSIAAGKRMFRRGSRSRCASCAVST
jgi:hypothetical protein